MYGAKYTYANPFPMNHCVVHAYTHCADGDKQFALKLANEAYYTRRHCVPGVTLLNRRGYAFCTHIDDATQWCKLAGLKLGERIRPVRRQQVSTFIRQHCRHGRYIMLVARHAFAVINGVCYGDYNTRSIVESAYRVEKIEPKLPRREPVGRCVTTNRGKRLSFKQYVSLVRAQQVKNIANSCIEGHHCCAAWLNGPCSAFIESEIGA